MTNLRVFERAQTQMQRLGFVKRLLKRVGSVSTTNLENLGNDLIDTVIKKQRVQLTLDLAAYVKARFIGKHYTEIRKITLSWLNNGGDPPFALFEIQDLYLCDPRLPSQVGKLVKEDWRRYTHIGESLGFVRTGTLSSTTRAISLLYFTTEAEQQAFLEFNPFVNPFFISPKQSLLFLYSFLDSDAEIIMPFWQALQQFGGESFNDRNAGDLLPPIFRNAVARYRRGQSLSINFRKRLESLEQTADSIARQLNIVNYSSRTAREDQVRVRLEPYVDMGILKKENPSRYEYNFSDAGIVWANATKDCAGEQAVANFLTQRFFATAAAAQGIPAQTLTNPEDLVPRLKRAWKIIAISSGYAPIEEIALVAGIESLVDDHFIIEIADARNALIAFQKANPYQLRFTVDRLGVLAHAKFIDASNK